jgi:beta-glucosidase-like glycosyl hydrolase
LARLPFCNASLGLEVRVADAVSRLTLAEKIAALGTGEAPLPSIDLPGYNWWSEATHGISHVVNDESTPFESNFAFPITTACSFNRSLWKATGTQIGREARAFMNAGNAFSTFWAPVVNIARDPRWGRIAETPGEDPFLSGEYAVSFVQGMERSEADSEHLLASACCKHFVANDLDRWNGSTRHDFNAVVSVQDLLDSYLPPFRACVEDGGVSGLMCSYNSVNSVPSCANSWLMTDVARSEWKFDGYITSDCDAVSDIFLTQNYTKSPEEAVAMSLKAGMDVDCGDFIASYGQSAIDKGLLSEADIDVRLHNLFRVRMRLGHFDPPGPFNDISYNSTVCTPYAVELARDGTRQGAVLLKNSAAPLLHRTDSSLKQVETRAKVLPLDGSKVKLAAVIGPNANLSQQMAEYYGGNTCGGRYWNLVDAIAEQLQPQGHHVVSALGVQDCRSDADDERMAEALRLVALADVVILALGQDTDIEHEGRDRLFISFSEGQLALIANVSEAARLKHIPLVAVVLTAGAIDLTPLLLNDAVGAILSAGQPSTAVLGVGDILFAKDGAGPAGRMVQTMYPADFVNAVSAFDMGMRPGPSSWPPFSTPGRTHRFYTGKPVVPFGFGLSYSTFEYKIVQVVC